MSEARPPKRMSQGDDDLQPDLAKVFGETVKALSQVRTAEPGATRLFFPDGIQRITLKLAVGPKDSPLFSAELDISGEKAKPNSAQFDSLSFGTADVFGAARGLTVTSACQEEWPAHKMFCNRFAIAVAGRFGISLSGLADEILTQIRGPGWTQIADGDGVAASNAAKGGKFVVGGSSSSELGDSHGHVVIVVPPTGPLGHGKYPFAYWGSENGAIRDKGGEGTTINWSFDETARDSVHYAAYDIGS